MSNTYDAIIVGARCAGAPTAMLLARAGYCVLLVDKATFPSDVVSGHYIHQPGVALLKRWGLLETVRGAGCPAVRRVRFDVGPFALEGTPPPTTDGQEEGISARRTVLDKLLVDAAAAAGAEVREGFRVQQLLFEGDRVVGLRGVTHEGQTVSERARIVIGSDGMRSLVARAVAAPTHNERPASTCSYYTYFSNLPCDAVEIAPRPGVTIVATPTNGNLTLVAMMWPFAEFREIRAEIQASFMRSLDQVPGLLERVRSGARRETPFYGTCHTENFFRQSYGRGWVLAGDARFHLDPITAQGMTNSFADAQALADALDSAWGGLEPLDEALGHYEKSRNGAVSSMYDFTCQLAQLQPPPTEMQMLFEALRGNQHETERFLGTIPGTVPLDDFYSPESMERILGPGAMTAV